MIELRTISTLQRRSPHGMVTIGGQVLGVVDATSLVGANFREWDLSHVDLQGADLRGADFTSAKLFGGHFEGANLRDANLENAFGGALFLKEACLVDANLRKTRLVGASLEGADLRGANLEGAILRFARYDEATLWSPKIDSKALGAKLSCPTEVESAT
jgi:uncharacterized protein YjbI with pentapeptide repeats